MRVVIVAVGKVKDRGLREALDDYLKRIGRYARVEETELKDADEDVLVERFRKAIPARARVVALEVSGQAWSSEQLAEFVGRCESSGVSALVFLIGGAYGLPSSVSAGADVQLSLSPMTYPHRLCRVVLAEQIYRAFTIQRNEPYSH